MRRSFPWFGYVVIGLIGIGIIANLKQLLIPILVIGIILLMYKFPPKLWRVWFQRLKSPNGKVKSQRKRAKSRLYVIDGRKNDDDLPKYH